MSVQNSRISSEGMIARNPSTTQTSTLAVAGQVRADLREEMPKASPSVLLHDTYETPAQTWALARTAQSYLKTIAGPDGIEKVKLSNGREVEVYTPDALIRIKSEIAHNLVQSQDLGEASGTGRIIGELYKELSRSNKLRGITNASDVRTEIANLALRTYMSVDIPIGQEKAHHDHAIKIMQACNCGTPAEREKSYSLFVAAATNAAKSQVGELAGQTQTDVVRRQRQIVQLGSAYSVPVTDTVLGLVHEGQQVQDGLGKFHTSTAQEIADSKVVLDHVVAKGATEPGNYGDTLNRELAVARAGYLTRTDTGPGGIGYVDPRLELVAVRESHARVMKQIAGQKYETLDQVRDAAREVVYHADRAGLLSHGRHEQDSSVDHALNKVMAPLGDYAQQQLALHLDARKKIDELLNTDSLAATLADSTKRKALIGQLQTIAKAGDLHDSVGDLLKPHLVGMLADVADGGDLVAMRTTKSLVARIARENHFSNQLDFNGPLKTAMGKLDDQIAVAGGTNLRSQNDGALAISGTDTAISRSSGRRAA